MEKSNNDDNKESKNSNVEKNFKEDSKNIEKMESKDSNTESSKNFNVGKTESKGSNTESNNVGVENTGSESKGSNTDVNVENSQNTGSESKDSNNGNTESKDEGKPKWYEAHKIAIKNKQQFYTDPETGYAVMTELSHLSRGYCCGNKCRHCPYNHENVGKEKNNLIRRDIKSVEKKDDENNK